MLLRRAYLGVTNGFGLLRLLRMRARDKDAEIFALRHQITVLERQLGKQRVRFTPSGGAFLAALLHWLPRHVLRRMRLLVRPDTVREDVSTARKSYAAAARLASWSLLYLFAAAVWWPAAFIGVGTAFCAAIRARTGADALASLVETAVDLHLTPLAVAVGLPVTGTPAEIGRAVADHFKGASSLG
ncbi:hypothetical protein ACWDA7_50830 [Streptomyces sp. NPDC001156]